MIAWHPDQVNEAIVLGNLRLSRGFKRGSLIISFQPPLTPPVLRERGKIGRHPKSLPEGFYSVDFCVSKQ
jgi:hypothetical protein